MKSKNLISLTIAFCFLIMASSGLMLYFGQKQWHAVETLHILFGVIFLGFAIFHILNNWSSITGYSKSRSENRWQKEFWIALGIFGIFLIGGSLEIPPFKEIAHGGKILFGPKRKGGEGEQKLSFDEIKTNQQTAGKPLNIILQKGKGVKMPVIAIWTEDSTHHFVENLFVPAQTIKAENTDEPIGKLLAEGEAKLVPLSPEVLPEFSRKVQTKTANYDKYSPLENFVLHTKTSLKGTGFIMLEIREGKDTELYEASINPVSGMVSALKATNSKLFESVMAGFPE